jgi:hypothetical protein
MKTALGNSESKFKNKIRTPLLLSLLFWQNALHIHARTRAYAHIHTDICQELRKMIQKLCPYDICPTVLLQSSSSNGVFPPERLPTCRRVSSVVGLLTYNCCTGLFGIAFPQFLMLWIYRHYTFITASFIPKQGPPRVGEVDIWGEDAALSL